jgi:hypothetical protein
MKAIDHSLENLLELNGERIVVDDSLGLWVKFEIKETINRQQGIRYSLTLHNKNNKRIMGFDNSHEVEYGAKKGVSPSRTYDHWHFDENDTGRPYQYTNAAQLIEDFWKEVDKRVKELKEKE